MKPLGVRKIEIGRFHRRIVNGNAVFVNSIAHINGVDKHAVFGIVANKNKSLPYIIVII